MKEGDLVEVYLAGKKYSDGIFIEADKVRKVCYVLINNERYAIPKSDVKLKGD